MRLLIATGNAHKLEECRRILAPLGITALSPAEVGCTLDVEETGTTFAENARLKAQALYDRTGLGVVADDSGLCVDALDGRPGVYTSRYQGENTPQTEKNNAILRELDGVPAEKRTARFVSSICCLLPDGSVIAVEGTCEGTIAFAPNGNGGFGYDPIFLVDGKSFAALSPEEKDAVSHRGKALRMLMDTLQEHLRSEPTETKK